MTKQFIVTLESFQVLVEHGNRSKPDLKDIRHRDVMSWLVMKTEKFCWNFRFTSQVISGWFSQNVFSLLQVPKILIVPWNRSWRLNRWDNLSSLFYFLLISQALQATFYFWLISQALSASFCFRLVSQALVCGVFRFFPVIFLNAEISGFNSSWIPYIHSVSDLFCWSDTSSSTWPRLSSLIAHILTVMTILSQ